VVDHIDVNNIDEIRRATGYEVIVAVCTKSDLTALFKRLKSRSSENLSPEDIDVTPPILEDRSEESDRHPAPITPGSTALLQEDSELVTWVNKLLVRAVRSGASDIHIEPKEHGFIVKIRRDGLLEMLTEPPKSLQQAAVSRIKIMARMNIAERRRPQDGRYSAFVDNRNVDFRVSTFPTIYGESLVLRVLDAAQLLPLPELGLSVASLATLIELINAPHGLFLVTGPTGSGKTMTLYAVLSKLTKDSKDRKNIMTLEDPVEFRLDGVRQAEVNLTTGFTYNDGLEHILRHDPNVIMVGEIRDEKTAAIAIQAALAGRLVFSTLHTNDAPSTALRLIDMGIEPFLVSATLSGVIAQRLIRKLCPHCREPYQLSEAEATRLNLPPGAKFFHAKGCPKCRNSGYRGRIGLFEVLKIGPDIKTIIKSGQGSIEDIQLASERQGTVTLWQEGIEKAMAGLTTLEEVIAATQH
jgi:type II secretory ATPase GspE/PulE/Tfp pilus assembly ATPase PilB-like protein